MCDVKEPLLLILLPCALPREGDVKPTRMNVKATADANKRAIDRARTVKGGIFERYIVDISGSY